MAGLNPGVTLSLLLGNALHLRRIGDLVILHNVVSPLPEETLVGR